MTARLSGRGATVVRIRSDHCWNQSLRQYQKAEKRPFGDLFWSTFDSLYRTSLNPISASRFKRFRRILCRTGEAWS